jgi:hypothetical protein
MIHPPALTESKDPMRQDGHLSDERNKYRRWRSLQVLIEVSSEFTSKNSDLHFRSSNGDIPMQPIKRDVRRDEYECAKYPLTLLMNSNRFPKRKIGLQPHMTAIQFLKKQKIPITKIPQPSPPLRVLHDMSNSFATKANPGNTIGP